MKCGIFYHQLNLPKPTKHRKNSYLQKQSNKLLNCCYRPSKKVSPYLPQFNPWIHDYSFGELRFH